MALCFEALVCFRHVSGYLRAYARVLRAVDSNAVRAGVRSAKALILETRDAWSGEADIVVAEALQHDIDST